MIFDLSTQFERKEIKQLCIPGSKIENQLVLASHGLQIPESLVLLNTENRDISVINRFISDNTKEYQIRSEGIGNRRRFAETSTGLSSTSVSQEFSRLNAKDKLLLIQKLPKNSLYRDTHSVQYCVVDNTIVMEIRAGIATHLARFGWPLSEYYDFPIDAMHTSRNVPKYGHLSDDEVHIENIFLDCCDFGLRAVKNTFHSIIDLPYNKVMCRPKKFYEISPEVLEKDISKCIIDKTDFEKIVLEYLAQSPESIVKKFLHTYKIQIGQMTFKQFLAFFGFLYHFNIDDEHDSLKERLKSFFMKNIPYRKLSSTTISGILEDAHKLQKHLRTGIAKLSIISSEEGTHILYWDLVS